MSVFAIIVAAGAGRRAGDLEKQFAPLAGRSVLHWSAEALRVHPLVEKLVIVAPANSHSAPTDLAALADIVVSGGATRTLSVRAGLDALPDRKGARVLIHDAARPGLTHRVIDDLIVALETHDAAAPALAAADALKRQTSAGLQTLDRTDLFRVQTPQAFHLAAIRKALGQEDDLVDDLAAIERLGGQVKLVRGEEALHKITYAEDFDIVERLMFRPTIDSAPRMGTGYDVHTFGPGDHVTLCGLKIPHDNGLVGHSDADVAWHALTDALLGALALGDIGDHFPPSDPKWKGAASGIFLEHAAKLARDRGYQIANVDLTIICEAPKVKPHREAMRQATAAQLGIDPGAVSIKATTTEGLGFTGRREGMAAQAAAVLTPHPKRD